MTLSPRCQLAAQSAGPAWASGNPAERARLFELFTGAQAGTLPWPGETASAQEQAAYTFGVCYRDPAAQGELWAALLAAAQPVKPTPGQGELRFSVTAANGIGWTFAGETVCGQYVNGDWWAVGPVTVTAISPASFVSGTYEVAGTTYPRTINGSMVDPDPGSSDAASKYPGAVQGYDSAIASEGLPYKAGYNAATKLPLLIATGSSLVSTQSVAQPKNNGQYVQKAAVLTVVAAVPPAGSFRPPYCKGSKEHRWNVADIAWSKLRNLPRLSGAPTGAFLAKLVDSVYLSHAPFYLSNNIRPVESTMGYGADMTEVWGLAAASLHLDYPQAEKERIAIGVLQVGIDFYGLGQRAVEASLSGPWATKATFDRPWCQWPLPGAGQSSGYNGPAALAAALMGKPEMGLLFKAQLDSDGHWSGVGLLAGERAQTFTPKTTRACSGTPCPAAEEAKEPPTCDNALYNGGVGWALGDPWWGSAHALNKIRGCRDHGLWPKDTDGDGKVNEGDAYQECCTQCSWWYTQLALLLTDGGRAAFDHEPYFLYADWYRKEAKRRGLAKLSLNGHARSINGWATGDYQIRLWDAYRSLVP